MVITVTQLLVNYSVNHCMKEIINFEAEGFMDLVRLPAAPLLYKFKQTKSPQTLEFAGFLLFRT